MVGLFFVLKVVDIVGLCFLIFLFGCWVVKFNIFIVKWCGVVNYLILLNDKLVWFNFVLMLFVKEVVNVLRVFGGSFFVLIFIRKFWVVILSFFLLNLFVLIVLNNLFYKFLLLFDLRIFYKLFYLGYFFCRIYLE